MTKHTRDMLQTLYIDCPPKNKFKKSKDLNAFAVLLVVLESTV